MSILPVINGNASQQADNRRVALLKSLATNNRFYALVDPDSGIKNADTIERFPDGMPLGIAYPCLEDGLNDFAIIRSTFETIDQFPDDEELRTELLEIIADAQGKLIRRLSELRDRIGCGQAHFLGTDLREFEEYIVNLCTKGAQRRTLDSMMKLDVFESVAQTEALLRGDFTPEYMYYHELLPENSLEVLQALEPRDFVARVFHDVFCSVEDQENYREKHVFDRNVFQKFIALMFVNYATTDPVFYGTNKADYGVSADKDMDRTPLYVAVRESLRVLEKQFVPQAASANGETQERPASAISRPNAPATEQSTGAISRTVELSNLPIADQQVLEHMTSISETARMLLNLGHPRGPEYGEMILRSTHRLFRELQEMGIVSPAADSPVSAEFRE